MKAEKTETLTQDVDEVLAGLSKSQKTLPCKLLYDEYGSRLFDKICGLDEYYPTRTEMNIMSDNIQEIVQLIGEQNLLVELGSGSSTKIRLLLEHISHLAGYVPIDISEEFLLESVEVLEKDYPDLKIYPVSADYTKSFDLPDTNILYNRRIVFYPGSTIGNFTKDEAKLFLHRIAHICGAQGGLLLGVDLKKDISVLEAAYNDSKGVTAEFNLNLLTRLNREIGSNFDRSKFNHQAIFNEEVGRVEMHLVSLEDQTVEIQDIPFFFRKGESIHTENSYKYSIKEFAELASEDFKVEKVWTDEKQYFSVQYLSIKK